MAFKYSFNTWCYSSFPVWVPSYPLEETAKRIARAGYDAMEIGCAAPHAFPAHLSPARRRELKKIISSEGLAVSSFCRRPAAVPATIRARSCRKSASRRSLITRRWWISPMTSARSVCFTSPGGARTASSWPTR